MPSPSQAKVKAPLDPGSQPAVLFNRAYEYARRVRQSVAAASLPRHK